MTITKVYLIPLSFGIIMPTTVFLTYTIAVGLGHVDPFFPYISDTGTFSPELCIFGQSMNILGLLNFLFTWVRYSHVKVVCGTELTFSFLLKLNGLGYWLGLSASIGTSMVGNFQETNMLLLHGLGAFFLFTPGLIYVWVQAFISFRIASLTGSTTGLAIFRLGLAVLGTLITISGFIVTPISILLFHGKDIHHWKPDQGGYVFHLISAIGEWLLCLGYALFISTFVGEFSRIHIETPEVVPNDEKALATSKFALLLGPDSSLDGSDNGDCGDNRG